MSGPPELQLPSFVRVAWVSEAARLIWQPRLDRVQEAWTHIEWATVVAHIRECAVLAVDQQTLSDSRAAWRASRLAYEPLSTRPEGSSDSRVEVAVGRRAAVRKLVRAWDAGDHVESGRLLGYPQCCCSAFQELGAVGQDPLWLVAARSAAAPDAEDPERIVTARALPALNVFWSALGVCAIPHLPCRLSCAETAALAGRLLELGTELGHGDEMQWLTEILSWPAQYSALHGIAEIKSPVAKLAVRAGETAERYVVSWLGSAPEAAVARGLDFPYRQPPRRRFTTSSSFGRGLANAGEAHSGGDPSPEAGAAPGPLQSWYFQENGFTTWYGMNLRHESIVSAALRELGEERGDVLDLGCGNGALVQRICRSHPGLVPWGIDTSERKIARARTLMPAAATNFRVGNLFSLREIFGAGEFALILLMVGRLVEVPRSHSDQLLSHIASISKRLLLYVYPGYGDSSLEALAARVGVSVDVTDVSNVSRARLEPFRASA